MAPGAATPAPTPSHDRIILACVNRVRRRLWITRLAERLSLALIAAGMIALPLITAKLLWDRYPLAAVSIALTPALAGLWLWFMPARLNHIIAPSFFIKSIAIAAAVLSFATIGICASPLLHHVPLWVISSTSFATLLLIAAASVRTISARSAAIFVDQQVGLKERVATALEFLQTDSPSRSPFEKPVIAAALEACRALPKEKVGYARAGARLYASAAAATLAAVSICFLPPLPSTARNIRRPNVAVIEKGKKLEAILNELEQKKPPENAVAEKKLQPLKDTLADLRKGNMSPFEADARLAEEKGDLQKEKDQMDASERVEKALDNIKGLDEVAKAGDQIKNANLKNANGGTANQSGKPQADQAMKDAAKSVGDKMKNGGMSADDKKKLADDLEHAAQQAGSDSQLQHELQSAADAAKKGDGDQLSKSLAAAGQRMGEQQADSQMSSEQVRQAMEAIDRAAREGNGSAAQSANGNDQQSNPQNSGQSSQASSGQQGASGGQNGQGASKKQQGGQASSGQPGGNPDSAGAGSTNLHAPSGPGDHSQGHPVGGTGEYVKVYDEKAIASQGRMEQVSGKINPLGAASGTQQILGQGDKSDSTIQTYESALPAAKKRALDDLQTQQIPPQYRDLIRNYYGQ